MSPDTGEDLTEIGVDQESDCEDGEGPANGAAAGFQNQENQNYGKHLVKRGYPLEGLVDNGVVNGGHIDAARSREDSKKDIVPGNAIQILVFAHGLHNEDQCQDECEVYASLDDVREYTHAGGIQLEQNQRHRQNLDENIPEAC